MADGGRAKVEGADGSGQRLFTSVEFHRMGASGILGPDERVELLDGIIYAMSPINPRHADAVDALNEILTLALNGRARIRVQNPVHLDDMSDPQPDVAAVVPRQEGYRHRHPGPSEIYFLAEVADTTLADDKHRKIPRYAQAGIQEVWLVDLERRMVTVYRDPSPEGYRSDAEVGRDRDLHPLAFPDVSIPAARFT